MSRKELTGAHRTFCENVVARRKELGYTQAEAARLMGVTQGSYAGYERGANQPTIGLIERIAEMLECEPFELLVVHVEA